MKFAMYTHFDRMLMEKGMDLACGYAAEYGFTYIEHIDDIHPGVKQSVNSLSEARDLRKALKRYGLEMACCSVFADVWTYDDALVKLKKQAEIAAETESPYLHHTCLPWLSRKEGQPSFKDGFDRAVDICGEVALYAKTLGVTAIYEEQGMYLNGCESFGRFINEMRKIDPEIGICGDMGNIMFAGEKPSEFFRRFASEIKHVHVKAYTEYDCFTDPGGLSYEIANGKWLKEVSPYAERNTVSELVRILSEAGYDGVYSFELSNVNGYEADLKDTMRLLESVHKSCAGSMKSV